MRTHIPTLQRYHPSEKKCNYPSCMPSIHLLLGLACFRVPAQRACNGGCQTVAMPLHLCAWRPRKSVAHLFRRRFHVVSHSSNPALPSCSSVRCAALRKKSGHGSRTCLWPLAVESSSSKRAPSDVTISSRFLFKPKIMRKKILCTTPSRLCWSTRSVHVSQP